MNKVITAVVLALAMASAVQAKPPVADKAEHWRQRLAQELPAGSSRSAVLAWAANNHLTASDKPETHELVMALERVPESASKAAISASTVKVCRGFEISATLKLDAEDRLTSTQVHTFGNCL